MGHHNPVPQPRRRDRRRHPRCHRPPRRPRQWRTRIPRPALAVTATSTDAATLTLTLDDAPAAGPAALTFHPWTAEDVMPIEPTGLPAAGRLTVCDIRIYTLAGRTVRYLIPAFTATA